MLYSHPALVQNSYWNPGRPCQVVINYCGSRGSVLQTDLHELRAFSSRICFQDLGCRAAKLSTKGTNPMSSGSATLVPLQPQGARKPSTAVFLGRQGGGQQGSSPALEHRAFQAKITSLFACWSSSTIELCWRRAQLSSASAVKGKRAAFWRSNNCCGIWLPWLEHGIFLTLRNGKVSHRMHVRSKMYWYVGNLLYFQHWEILLLQNGMWIPCLPLSLNPVLSGARTALKASFGYICVVHFSWMVKKPGKSCFAVEREKSQLVIKKSYELFN